MASKNSATNASRPSPMDGKNHMEVFYALVAAGASGMHNPPQKKVKKS